MRFLVAVSLLFAFFSLTGAVRFDAVPDYSSYTFERFEVEYAKKYSSPRSREAHRAIFQQNLQKIREHNARPAASFFLKINQNADLTEETIVSKLTGNNFDMARANRKRLRAGFAPYQGAPVGAAIPDSVDWRNQGAVSAVKDQKSCGSCWAFAAVETIESQLFLNTKQMTLLSPQHTLQCTPNPNHCGGKGGCQGATCELAFEWAKGGVASEATMPYKGVDGTCPTNVPAAAKVGGWVRLPENNATALLEAVATVGPIAVSVDASAWSFYGGGVFNGCNAASPVINHAVQLVGYGTDAATGKDYWLVRNSWGTGWGEGGYIRLLREKEETCGMNKRPQDGVGCDGETDPVKVCGTCGIHYDNSYPTGVTSA